MGNPSTSDISDEDCEAVVDGVIDLLNTFGAELDNLTGAAGSKTGDYTSNQAGAIMTLAQYGYVKYTNADNTTSAGLGPASISFAIDNQMLEVAEKLAKRLKGSTIAFVVAEDTSGLTDST